MLDNVKVLVAAPTFEGMKYCHEEFFSAIKNLAYQDYDILIVDNSKKDDYFNELVKIEGIKVIHDNSPEEKSVYRLISSRNLILDYGKEHSYTHILMLDSDVIPPKDIIEELLKCDKPIVSGLYFNYFLVSGKKSWLPVAWKNLTEKEIEELKKISPQFANINQDDIRRHITQEEINSNELHKVAMPSAGCMLIRKEVFEKVKYGKVKKTGADDDIYFIEMARELGFESYCYTKIKCEHLIKGKYKRDEKGNLIHSSFSDMM